MKRTTLHLQASALLAPCLLAFSGGCLLVNVAGAAYMAGLVYVCCHTVKGRRFARACYKEILTIEKLLSE